MTEPVAQTPPLPARGAPLHLRILQTTDVHGHLLPFDYYTNQSDRPWGLARLATLIRRARSEVGAANCLLFDNGDFLQGTPLTDLTAQPDHGWTEAHPVIAAMNDIGYDAGTLGNHEFNFGLDWLMETLAQARFPLTCCNVLTRRGATPTEDTSLLPPYLLLDRQLEDTDGQTQRLRIGVLGLVPPQILTWDHARLSDRVEVRDMVESARAWVPVLHAAGADLVVVLAHSGLDPGPDRPMMENAARALARLPGIDALLAGHSHKSFPSTDHQGIAGADATRGTLHDTPCVMAGFRGDHLGQLDLTMSHDGTKWRVTGHQSRLLPASSAQPCPALCTLLDIAHHHTLTLTAREIGQSLSPLHSYLSLVRDDPILHLVNDAQHRALAGILANGPLAQLPLLSACAPFKTGGRGGPLHFTDIPEGPLRLRHIADLYGFPNTLCGLLVTGAELRDWLERAAICFNRLAPGLPDQPLLDPAVPGHDFDVIDGLSYAIDLSQPARYDISGALIHPEAQRIRDLRHAGKPVRDDAHFIVATNSYRAHGGGPFAPLAANGLIYSGTRPVRDILADHVAALGQIGAAARPTWRFAPLPGTTVTVETGPGLRAHPADIAALNAIDLGLTDTGFLRLSLPLPDALPTLAHPVAAAYMDP
ncbi:bifunctional 2',3'-cyclic-nucleotide 2'-phosphodiesterase/3'-nucleotidase [Roseovarius sp.]|uniref:bifunctional 2',3'-cyclic-nucleotide 2'-phosphodiesterase/3'-nucleotidase n=1 Tax=Roseovarius sp. TaxID=1486281 RepID=UPI0025EE278B|nr:bifunctional 2',3'-cyclic-nucleotide 2'-phosphodiesterase/3'-nucleotidase [Roseovarius sp.]